MNPQIGQYRGVANKAPKSEKSHTAHASGEQSHDSGESQPHEMTGVHKVTMVHKGGGKFETHTHHEAGGEPEVQHHENASSAHAAVKEALPSEGGEQEPDGDEGVASPMDGMAGEMGDGGY